MRYLIPIPIVFVLIFSIAGCRTCDCDEYSYQDLMGIQWRLKSFDGGNEPDQGLSERFLLTFWQNRQVNLTVSCNSCFGSIEWDSNGFLRFKNNLSCTEVYCGDDSRDRDFYPAIEGVTHYKLENGTLSLYYGHSGKQLLFVQDDAADK